MTGHDDRTVQVPVSLIEHIRRDYSVMNLGPNVVDALDALLSQPTPTAEPVSPLCLFGHDVFTAGGYCRRCGASMLAEPELPRIEDMTLGTTCPECHRPHRLEEDSEYHLGLVCSECGSLLLPIGTRFIGQEHAGDLQPLIFTISQRGTAAISEPSVMGWAASDIDPSTIRNVTPPKENPDA